MTFPDHHHAAIESLDAIVAGAGLAGISMLYRLKRLGLRARVFEAAAGVGGTWYHNRYPGARCDIESLDYSYSFSEELQQEWSWSERYASQPEILDYINHVADRFSLREDVVLNTRVTSAEFVEGSDRWEVCVGGGGRYRAKYFILATGVLSAAQVPRFEGLDSFRGQWYHTADWPHEGVDCSARRVGVIGTGSSGTQLIPIVAEQAEHLTVFQRTANFVMPAQNHPLDPEFERDWKAHYPDKRRRAWSSRFGHNQLSNEKAGKNVTAEQRRAEFERRWQLGGLYMMRAFTDIMTDADVNDEAAAFVRGKIRDIVKDPQTAEKLMPRGLYLGTKRLCSGTNYFETFNRPNVELVDVKADPIVGFTPTGLVTHNARHELDTVIFATGFDAMTGSMLGIDIRGRDGRRLQRHWSAGPRTYLGLATSGFPNMFVLAGPQSPSVFSNMVTSIEQHTAWVRDALSHLEEHGHSRIEATRVAEDQWVEHVTEAAGHTLYPKSADSWFFGANIPGKPRVFMPYVAGVNTYMRKLTEVAEDSYAGFDVR